MSDDVKAALEAELGGLESARDGLDEQIARTEKALAAMDLV